jgi:hypothetical protein
VATRAVARVVRQSNVERVVVVEALESVIVFAGDVIRSERRD